jgi:hypothetical protein
MLAQFNIRLWCLWIFSLFSNHLRCNAFNVRCTSHLEHGGYCSCKCISIVTQQRRESQIRQSVAYLPWNRRWQAVDLAVVQEVTRVPCHCRLMCCEDRTNFFVALTTNQTNRNHIISMRSGHESVSRPCNIQWL